MDETKCPICRRVRRGDDPEDALARHLGLLKRITDDPPEPLADVRQKFAAETCDEHGLMLVELDDVAILLMVQEWLIGELERLAEVIEEQTCEGPLLEDLLAESEDVEARLDRIDLMTETS